MEEPPTAKGGQTRVEALTAIRSRIAIRVGGWLKDEECVQLALACATRQPREVAEFMFSTNVARAAAEAGYDLIGITRAEWKQLFGPTAQPTRLQKLSEIMRDPKFATATNELGKALQRTVEEPVQKAVWNKAWSKTILYSAMHMNNDEDLMEIALGNLVTSDTRRLEDLRSKIDDKGMEIMLLCTTLVALSETVT